MSASKSLKTFDSLFIDTMQGRGITFLRIALAIVYIWFGLLKVMGVSPVEELIASTYPLFPEPLFIMVLGLWEIIIGLGLLFNKFLRVVLALLWLQMAGVFFGFLMSPEQYFLNGNPLLLSVNGEFVIKNLVLVAASIVIGGYEVRKSDKKNK